MEYAVLDWLFNADQEDDEISGELPEDSVALRIPNEEIRRIYESSVSKWFDESAVTWNRTALFEAVWSGDCESITKEMSVLLRRTISYHDYREDFYHAFLSGIFAGAGYQVQSDERTRRGTKRCDCMRFHQWQSRKSLKPNERRNSMAWKTSAIRHCSRSMREDTRKISRMLTIIFYVMGFRFIKNAVW